MRIQTLITKFMALFVITGCVSTTLKPDDPKANLYQNLSISPIAAGLDNKTLTVATNTEFATLESGAVGLPVKWVAENGVSGTITPGQNFSVSGATCRNYIRAITRSEVEQTQKLTACRNAQGAWNALD